MTKLVLTILTLAVFTVLGTSSAFAGGDETAFLSRVGLTSSGTAYLWRQGSGWNSSLGETGCTDTTVLAFDASTANGQQLYRLLLSAYLAKREVKVWTSGCQGSAPRVTRIDAFSP